jgi:3-oxoadipate enol-lactonase
MAYAPVEGGQLFYRVDGKPDSPVLVFSNSLGTDHSMWRAQAPVFSGQFRVVRYDSRGHGGSTVTPGEYTIERLGRDVLSLLDHLEVKTAFYCGLSVGGLVGQWLAAHSGERFDRVVLSSTAAKIGTPEIWKQRIETIRKEGIAAIVPPLLERWFTAGFRQREPGTVERFRKMVESTPAEGYLATCAAIRDADFRGEVSRIRLKTLVIAGTHDTSTPPEGGRFLAQQIPGATYVELDAAHLSNVELPQRFSEEVLRFLKS